MRSIFLTIVILMLIAAAFAGGIWYAQRAPTASAASKERKVLYWVDSMNPAFKSDKPGKAPDGMDLVPVYADDVAPDVHQDRDARQDHAGTVAGGFQISPEKQQLIGVTFSTAEIASGGESVRAVGRVTPDETRITRVHPKIEGWIEKTQVDFTGQLIAKGDPLLSIYSPEMLASQQEFLLALRARETMRSSPSQEASLNADSLVAAAHRRLELWDLSAVQLEQVEQSGTPLRAVTLYSPAGGYVTSRNAFPGQKVAPETELYAISDLSRIWIMADVFEVDLPKVSLGQSASVAPASGSGAGFSARVAYIQPQIDPTTRTLKVRLEADNPNLRLKPDMFVNVEFRIGLPARVTVPADAVVNTGTRQTVFVDLGDGRLEPRAVQMGERFGDRVQILQGLRVGERVVSSGTFLVDSEAQLKGQIKSGGGLKEAGKGTPMIDRIIEFSGRNKFVVFALVAFAVTAGIWSMRTIPLDAIPDLSDTQVIIYSRWDRSPDILEDQVTYPIVTAMLGAPHVKDVRGFSDFGYSFVYVIFDEGTDVYWARSRTLEYLQSVLPRMPKGVETELGPDATGVGWVFQYALLDPTHQHSLAELRSTQDWFLRYQLRAVPGVAEVAPLGGFVRQYQVNVDPRRLQAFQIPIMKVVEAVRAGNNDVGGRLIESSGAEYMVRGHGYAKSTGDLRRIVLATTSSGTPIRVQDVGDVTLGPDLRRGVADWNGEGDTVAGIVVIRQGENALAVIDRVKAKLKEIEPGLPAGVKVVTAYDRSDLILRSIENLKATLIEEMVIVALIILLFLWHIPSALIPVVTIPFAIVIGFIPMRAMGLTSNIMSLGGIAIAIGAMVDASIVVVEQTHKKLEEWERTGRKADYRRVVIDAVKEVGGPSFFALLVIAVSFLPVLTLEAQEGRLFKPLAYTKTISMIVAAVLAITLDPAMRLLFTRMRNFEFRPRFLVRFVNAVLVGRIHSEENHPISRILIRIYGPVCAWVLRWKWMVIVGAIAVVAFTIPVYFRLGSEFMPPLDEGTLLYMPSTLPGISLTQAQTAMQVQDRILRRFPEVESVLGKAGRAETSTDPAPLSMMETVVVLKPRDQWRSVSTWYTGRVPSWMLPILRHLTSDRISTDQLVQEMDRALTLPGFSNAWTMPVKGRIDMLTTGVRTPVGVKIYGSDIQVIEGLGAEIEKVLPSVAGTRNVFAERTGGGYFLDFDWNRDALARYGLSIDDAQAIVMNAVGGDNVTTTVEGRERYSVNVRYMRDFRSDVAQLSRVLVPLNLPGASAQIPVSELATLRMRSGPGMIRDENGLLSGYVYVDVAGRDIGGYVSEAKKAVRDNIKLPAGYSIAWSGQYEALERVRQRLIVVIPLTLFLILMLLYMNTKSLAKTAIIVLAVPFSAVGAIWFLYALGYNMSIGVWVGLIALMGVDAETGVFMLLYLDLAYNKAREEGRLRSLGDLQAAIRDGAVKRIRPKFMTVACMFLGLVPILWSTGTGADVMKRIAAPMVGGIFTSFLLELLVYPAIYEVWKWHFELRRQLS